MFVCVKQPRKRLSHRGQGAMEHRRAVRAGCRGKVKVSEVGGDHMASSGKGALKVTIENRFVENYSYLEFPEK